MAGIVPIHSIHIVSSIVFYLPALRAKVKKASKTVRAWEQAAACSVARSQQAGLGTGNVFIFILKQDIHFRIIVVQIDFHILRWTNSSWLNRGPVSY